MAKAGASKEDDDSFYILYCCIRCDEKFTTAKLLKSHKEKCIGAANTGWIKQEANDDGESSPSQQEDPVDVIHKAEDSPPFQDHVAPNLPSKTFHPPPLKIKLNQIKNEPKDQPPSLRKQCAPTTVIPQQTRPLLVMTPGQIVSPQFSSQQQGCIPQPPLASQSSELKPQYYNAAHKLPASEILRQRFQNTQSHQTSGSDPPPPVTMKDHHRKKSLLTTSTVRSIRPKDSIVQDAIEPVLPKIENVYYTSKSSEDPVGQATLADSVVWCESDSHEERVLNSGNSHKTSVNVSSKSKCSKKPKSSHVEKAKKISNTNITPSHQIILTTKAAQSHNQSGDVASDFLRQAALPVQKSQVIPVSQVVIQTHQGIFQVPSSFLQNPQNILPGSLPVLQTSQPVLQNTQTLLQPNMLQQNFLQAQVVQQNLQTPLMLSHPPVSQIMPVVNPQPPVAGAVSASKAEDTITTTASKKSDSAAVSVVMSETVTSSMSNPVMSTSAPVVALSHIVGGIPPVPAAQTMQFTVPNPNGSGFLVLAGDVKQAPSASEPKANSSEIPGKKPLLTPPVGNLPVVSLANQQHGLVQSPSSNVLLLPPVMAQGHILSGIRLQSSNLNLTAGQSKKFVGESTPSTSSVSENPSTNVSSSADAATKPLDIIQESQSQLQGLPVMKFKQPEDDTAIAPQSSIDDNKSSGQGKLQSDKTVLDVAELLLFGDKTHDFKKWGPAVLNDGRIFVPVAYTGPYKLKSTESSASSWPGKTKSTKKEPVEKGDHGKNTEKKHLEHKGGGESTLAQTVTLPGDVVWIFLDRDGPKIVWKMDTVPPQVMVLPLDFDLPAEALRQVAEMLHKADIEFPKGLLNLPPVPKKVLIPKPGTQPPIPSFRRVEYKMMQIMNRKSKLLLPKGDAPATSAASTPAISPTVTAPTHSTSRTAPTPSPTTFTPSSTTPVSVLPPPLQVRPSNSGTKHSFPGTVLKKGNLAAGSNITHLPMLISALQSPVTPLKSAVQVQNPTPPFAANSLSSMNPALFGSTPTVIQASNLKVEDTSQENVSQPAIATVAAAAAAAVFKMSEPQEREWGKRRQKNVPQLTVNADPKTVKRALDAFVRVERISLTQELEQQAQSYRKARKTQCLALYGNSLMRNCRSKSKNVKDEPGTFVIQNEIKSENRVLRLDSEKETSKEMEAEENSLQKKGNNQSKVKILPNKEKDHKGRKRLVDKDWVAKSSWKRQRTNEFEYDHQANRDESLSGSEHKMRKSSRLGSSEEDVRRSVRICCKPKPDYSALNSQDYLDAEIDQKCDSVEGTFGTVSEVSGVLKFQEKASAGKGKSVVPSASKVRSLGKHSGFDVYIESAEGGDDEIDDEDEGGLVIDESIGDQPAEGQDSSDSLELFLKKHKRDVQHVVMKEAKGKEASDNILYLCIVCGSFQSRSRDELVSHLKQHYNGELSCKTCQFQAASKQELLEHDALEHTGKPLYHCPSCTTSFFSQAIYQNHLKRHNASVVCKVCSRVFLTEGGLKEHMEKDHIKEFPCLMCDQRFISEDKLRSHYTHCKEGFQCCLCFVKLALLEELGEHMEAAHHFKDNLYICNVYHCGATFITESALKHHATNVMHL